MELVSKGGEALARAGHCSHIRSPVAILALGSLCVSFRSQMDSGSRRTKL